MNLKAIQNLIKFVSKTGVQEVKLEMKDVKLTIKSGAEKIIKHHPREGGRSELSGIKNLVFNSLRMIKYMLDLKNEIKKIHSN